MEKGLFAFVFTTLLALCLAYTHQDAVCFDTCSEGLDYVTFGDVPLTIDYYVEKCRDDLMTRSTFLCARYYCSEQEIRDGWTYLNNEICELYGHIPLASLSIVKNVTQKDIQNMTRARLSDITDGTVFNHTVILDQAFYDRAFRTVNDFDYETATHVLYGWAMYIFWAMIILISLTTKLVIFLRRKHQKAVSFDSKQATSSSKRRPIWRSYSAFTTYIRTAPTFGLGTRCSEPYFWCTVPPLIETLTILAFITINIVLCCVNYRAFNGNLYFSTKPMQTWRYISDRTGIIAFANLPILWTFGTRNNVLIWLTGWNFSTFNSFHRWVARITALEAVVHSIGYTVGFFLLGGAASYDLEWTQRYFWNGAIAIVSMCLMLVSSVHGLRKHFYEVFLVFHIALALIIVVALFYHVAIFNGQYNAYLWAVAAIWCFDRFARLVRIVMLNGKIFTQSASAWYSENSETIYLEVPTAVDIRLGPGTFYFVKLLHGRQFWQAHPFTAVSLVNEYGSESDGSSKIEGRVKDIPKDAETNSRESTQSVLSLKSNRLLFAVRPYHGFTARLQRILAGTAQGRRKSLRVLLEGPYGHAASVRGFDNNVFIVGGSGITAALSHLQSIGLAQTDHRPSLTLHWSVRHIAAFEEFREDLAALARTLDAKVVVYVTREPKEDVERVKIKENIYPSGWTVEYGRMDVSSVVRESPEIGSTAIVGCGPARMMDETRSSAVLAVTKDGRNVQYFQETFGW